MKNIIQDIDTKYQNNLICPHCGYEDKEPYEVTGDEENGNTECGNCGKYYQFTRYINISYSTFKTTLREINQEEKESEKRKEESIKYLNKFKNKT